MAPVLPRPLSRFEIGLASAADDPELRALLRHSPIPATISVTFEREPDFFESCRIRGDFVQVAVGRDRRDGRIIGLGTRSITPAFINGVPMPLGYLADLRLEAEFRGGTLIARGYRFLRHLHEDRRTNFYATVIFSSNQTALKTLATGRAGLPHYHDMGVIHSPGIRIRRRKPITAAGYEIRRGSQELLPEIIDCLNRNNARRQFAPMHSIDMFCHRWRGLCPEAFVVAIRHNRIIGVVGSWDQTSFKQTRIAGYRALLRWLVPFANALSPWTGTLYPKPGDLVPHLYLGFIAVDHDDLDVFAALLRRALNNAAEGRYLYAIIALHECDPLLQVVWRYSRIRFSGRLFCVTLDEDGQQVYQNLDGRIPYLEAATF
jgi:hypothetical protein